MMGEELKNKLTRRSLVKSTFAIFAVSASGLKASEIESKNPFKSQTLQLLCQTIVPGGIEDTTGAPGALEAKTIEYLWRVERKKLLPVPLNIFGSLIISSLNTTSFFIYRKKFKNLDLKRREIVARKIEGLPGVHLFYKVIRAPFYTGAVNNIGYKYFGYPGANNGYFDYSYKQKLAKSHNRSVNGNLP
jgi:hypothetical protein